MNEKTLKISMVDKTLDEKEALELKKVYNHYLDKTKDIIKTSFQGKSIFGDIISKDSISPEQITKLKNFLAKMM